MWPVRGRLALDARIHGSIVFLLSLALVSHLANTVCRHEFPSYKALRLSSPRFAYLDALLKELFGEIQLIPTPENSDLFESADIGPIAPFVKKVTFVAPLLCWALEAEGCKETVLAQTIQNRASYCYDFGHDYYAFLAFVEQHWDGRLRLSGDQVRDGTRWAVKFGHCQKTQ